jgi:hypothetical protein
MIELLIKLCISLAALCAGAYLATGGTLPYGIVAAGVVGIGRRELRFASIRYRPNRSYYQLAVVGIG